MNVVDYLFDHSAEQELAIITKKETLNYSQLKQSIIGFSSQLRKFQLLKGQRVVLVADNSPFWVIAYLSILKLGGVVVPLAPKITPEEFQQIIAEVEPSLICMNKKSRRRIKAYLPSKTQICTEDSIALNTEQSAETLSCTNVSKDDLAAIMYTSGSTGSPLGVMVSHGNIMANTSSIIAYLKLSPLDKMMVVLPFYYCFGTSLLHTHLKAGSSLVLNNQFMFPDRVLQEIQEHQCTGFAGVPSTYQLLLRQSSFKSMQFPSLKTIQQAGGKLSPDFINELRKCLPEAKIYLMYGQTEATARLSYLPPEKLQLKPDSIGQSIDGVSLQILNENGEQILVGEAGELVARGDNISTGYWKNEEESRQIFKNGSLYTGDIATFDADGDIYIIDRKKAFLKLGGFRVSTKTLELGILKFPGTIELAIIAIPDPIQGEAVKLFIAHPKGQSIKEELTSFCVQTLPLHHRPKSIVFLESLPKNKSGKIDRQALKANKA